MYKAMFVHVESADQEEELIDINIWFFIVYYNRQQILINSYYNSM